MASIQDIVAAYNSTVGTGQMTEAQFAGLAPAYGVTPAQLVAAQASLLGANNPAVLANLQTLGPTAGLDFMRELPQAQVLDYLRATTPTQTTITPTFDPNAYGVMSATGPGGEVYRPIFTGGAGEGEVPQLTGYQRDITQFDPRYEGGVYGTYGATYDPTGQLQDIAFRQDERNAEGVLDKAVQAAVIAGITGGALGMFPDFSTFAQGLGTPTTALTTAAEPGLVNAFQGALPPFTEAATTFLPTTELGLGSGVFQLGAGVPEAFSVLTPELAGALGTTVGVGTSGLPIVTGMGGLAALGAAVPGAVAGIPGLGEAATLTTTGLLSDAANAARVIDTAADLTETTGDVTRQVADTSTEDTIRRAIEEGGLDDPYAGADWGIKLGDWLSRNAGTLATLGLGSYFGGGGGMSTDERELLRRQLDELQRAQAGNRTLFDQRMQQAQALGGEARYFDPEYFGLQRARRAQLAGAKAKRAGLRGLTGPARLSEQRRFDLATARDVGTSFDEGYLTGTRGRLGTMEAGLRAMPTSYPTTSGEYSNLRQTYSQAQERARQQARDIGGLIGSIFD